MNGEEGRVTAVTILNQTYQVRGASDPEYLQELAGYVDRKMTELSRSTPTVDTLRIAVLAALNIADDLQRVKQERDDLLRRVQQRAERMQAMLEPWTGDEAP